MSKAPDRGSFPLDHFHQCDEQAKKYSQCVQKHQLMPKRCRDFQMKYLNCRMKSGLMEDQQMQKLGFLKENSWQTQQAEKQFLFNKIFDMKQKAWQSAMKNAQQKKKNTPQQSKLPQ